MPGFHWQFNWQALSEKFCWWKKINIRFIGCLARVDRITSFQQPQEVRRLLCELTHRTLFGRFVRSPAKRFRTVAEVVGGYMVEADFKHELGLT